MKKENKQKKGLSLIGEVFEPLIPGAITAGLCAGFASLLAQVFPNYMANRMLTVTYRLLNLISISFLSYMTAWVGYSCAQRFGATPILGGMLGLITSLGEIDLLAQVLGLYNAQAPQESVLCSGRGGVLAVIFGVWLLAKTEMWLDRRIRSTIKDILVPFLAMLVCTVVYIFLVMPLAGYVSAGICHVIEIFCMSESAAVRIAAGAISAALFLPLVATGMNLGLTAIYSMQLETVGYISLYPALAMAGAGQVGACVAIYFIAKDNLHLRNLIKTAVPAGICGVGHPLIYGVTLPLGKPFLAAGLGAVFGGAYVTAMQVASTTWGPSGILAVIIMTAGPSGALGGMFHYTVGLLISAVMGFLITRFMIHEKDIAGKLTGQSILQTEGTDR